MTAILGVFGGDGAPPLGEAAERRMLGAMGRRGASQAGVWRQGSAVLAVARQGWEFGPGFSGPVLAVEDGDCVVVADASLYYRDDLRRRLAAAGVRPSGQTPSHLILAAYRAWGEACPAQLEGDFAFVLYDRRARRLLAARDHMGQRPLFYAELGDTLVVASSIAGILEHPRCSAELDLSSLAIDAAGLIFSGSSETAYRGVVTVLAGHTVLREGNGRVRTSGWWNPEVRAPRKAASVADAAAELRDVIQTAVAERLDSTSVTTLWLSGGYDSTAVYGAGQRHLASTGEGHCLQPVSVSYPPGDPGREDERISSVASFWGGHVHWVDINRVSMFEGVVEHASYRDEPYVHLFDQWIRGLARGSRELDARITLNGHGGDFLFQGTPIYLADLLSRGRVVRLAREWRAMGVQRGRAQHLFHWAVQPLVPPSVLQLAERTRGRRFEGYFERAVPAWFTDHFVRTHHIAERAGAGVPRWPRSDRSAYEMHWYLTAPFYPRVNACTAAAALEEGVETRSPLYDARVVRLAASRPREDRNALGEIKPLLRRAMHGLLPEEARASRTTKTGTLRGFFTRSMLNAAPLFLEAFRAPVLEALGIVDGARLRQEAERYFRHGGVSFLAEQLLSTFHAELWARARVGGSAASPPVMANAIVASDAELCIAGLA